MLQYTSSTDLYHPVLRGTIYVSNAAELSRQVNKCISIQKADFCMPIATFDVYHILKIMMTNATSYTTDTQI